MVFYNCPRCGFQTELRANMSRHYIRKFNCQPLLENISIQECVNTSLYGKTQNSLKNPEKITENSLKNPENHENSLKNPEKRHTCIHCKKNDIDMGLNSI